MELDLLGFHLVVIRFRLREFVIDLNGGEEGIRVSKDECCQFERTVGEDNFAECEITGAHVC